MSDELDIRLKATVEADEAASIKQIQSQIPSIEKGLKSAKIKVPVEADVQDITKSVQESAKAATSSLKAGAGGQKVIIPVDAAFNIKLQDTNAVAKEAKRLIEQLNVNKGPLIDFKIKTEGVKEANSILLTYKNSAEETIKTMLRLVDVTTDLNNPEFQWQITSTEFEKNIQKYEKGISAIKEAERKAAGQYWQNSFKESVKSLTPNNTVLKDMKNYYAEMERVANKATELKRVVSANGKLDLDFSPLDNAINTNNLDAAIAAFDTLNSKYDEFKINAKKDLPNNAIENLPNQLITAQEAIDRLLVRFSNLQSKGIDIPIELNLGGADSPTNALGDIEILRERLRGLLSKESLDLEDVKVFKNLSLDIEKLKSSATGLESVLTIENAGVSAEILHERYVKLLQTLDNLKKSWSAFTKDPQLLSQFNALRESISGALSSGDLSSKGWSLLNTQLGVFKANVEGAGKNAKSFFGLLSDNARKFSQWFFLGSGIATAVRTMKDVFVSVKEVDQAMVQLKKVTDETDATYENFLRNASKRAVDLGASLSGYVETVASFSRMGFNLPDSQALADAATIYYNVGDGMESMEQATNSIISVLKAYRLEASEATRVTDVFNEISNRFAVTSSGIGEGMQRAGAALATSNTSLEKSVALWTAMNEVIQNDESSATSLRFIAQRMRNTAGELEEMGEDAEGAAESVTKLQQQVLKLTGVNIMSDSETFRDVYDVLKDISGVWDDLTDKDRSDVIRLMAGNTNALAA